MKAKTKNLRPGKSVKKIWTVRKRIGKHAEEFEKSKASQGSAGVEPREALAQKLMRKRGFLKDFFGNLCFGGSGKFFGRGKDKAFRGQDLNAEVAITS